MKKLIAGIIIILIIIAGSLWYADATNPYSSLTIVKPFFTASANNKGQLELNQTQPIYFVKNPVIDLVTYWQRGFRTISNARFSEKPFTGNEEEIIAQIHAQRFDTTKPYVISGAHFAEFYVRNFGIFYSAVLDPRFALSQKDWEDREKTTLITVATHLELLRLAGKEYTTFIPMWSNTFTAVNWATEPSDSLFSLYYTLSALTNDTFIATNFPANTSPKYTLQTQEAGKKLLASYKETLTKTTNDYLRNITDENTGLIKTSLPLSSARDGVKRQSSFYDNVIAWSTAKMATDLGIRVTCPPKFQTNGCDFDKWKQTIISAFWDNKAGIFLDDLSEESKTQHIYSGDAFIVTSTKFLDTNNAQDRNKMEREIAYVQKYNLDTPFPLQYAVKDQPDRLYSFVKYFATSYMGETIWSHWGIEYIKTLILLSKYKPEYLDLAKRELASYKHNIEKFGGYPEVYDTKGNMYQTPFYKSVLHTGWVINYEEAKMMLGK